MLRLTKLFSLLLCLVLVLSIIPTVFAQETEVPAVEQVTEEKHPCCEAPEQQFGPFIMGEVREGRPTKGVTYYTSEKNAALELRAGMEKRQTSITVGFKSPVYTQEYLDYLYDELFDRAIAHTGVDSQGDYLRKEWETCGGSAPAYSSGGYYYISLIFNITYKTTAAQEAALTAALDQFISANIESTMTDYEKFRVCYDWICENITYDYTNTNGKLKYTAYAAMINKTAVCQGYATLLYRMLLRCDIDCRYISGIGNGGPHGWNIVQMSDGYYYNCDSTWDAGYAPQNYDYCLVSDANFDDHTRDADYSTTAFYNQYPMGQSNYVATENYVTQAVAVEQLRQQLKNRTNTIKVCINMTKAPTDAVILEMMERVLAHTGVPDEGDYLKQHIYSMTPAVEYVTSGSKYLVTLQLNVVYYSTATQEQDLTNAIALFKAVNIKAGMTDYEKFDVIYSWICSNITYGTTPSGGSNAAAYTAMILRGGSPRAFATLLYRLLLECGVDCRVIKGTVNSGTGVHYWNIVKMDGKYYNADPGWDASYFQDYGQYYCRLECNDTFTNHVRDSAYNTTAFNNSYPMGTVDYTPPTRFDIDVARMILGNALEFQFGVSTSKIPNTTGYYAVIEKEWADGTTTQKTIPASQWGVMGGYYAIIYDGLAAKEMADAFYVTIYNANGAAVSNAKEDSVRDYVSRAYASQSAKGKTMMVDMLNYGAAAQTHFNYGTSDLANAKLTTAQKAVATATAPEMSNDQVKGANYQGTRFLLTSSIQVQLAFSNMTTDMYAIYTYRKADGTAKEVRVEGTDFVVISGKPAGVELSALVYADARALVTVRVYKADGTLYAGAKDSIESCALRSNADVFVALMKFADSAKAHLYG